MDLELGGLFHSNSGTITHLILEAVNVSAGTFSSQAAGSVVAWNSGIISNVVNRGGTVSGYDAVGGIAGWNNSGGIIRNSHNAASVIGNEASTFGDAGGITGRNNNGTISNSSNTGSILGDVNAGGLVGEMFSGTISNSYNTGAVTSGTAMSDPRVGGLVGEMFSGTISNSYSRGAVSSSAWAPSIGGVIGLRSRRWNFNQCILAHKWLWCD